MGLLPTYGDLQKPKIKLKGISEADANTLADELWQLATKKGQRDPKDKAIGYLGVASVSNVLSGGAYIPLTYSFGKLTVHYYDKLKEHGLWLERNGKTVLEYSVHPTIKIVTNGTWVNEVHKEFRKLKSSDSRSVTPVIAHVNTSAKETDTEKYRCLRCSYVCQSGAEIRTHINDVHNGVGLEIYSVSARGQETRKSNVMAKVIQNNQVPVAKVGAKEVMYGIGWAFIGIIITVVTYSTAQPGGLYIVAFGPVLYGGYMLLKGLYHIGIGK